VENRGLWALEAPPKRVKQMNTRGPIYRLTGYWSAFERTTCVRTHQLFVVERKAHVRSQILLWRLGLTGCVFDCRSLVFERR
jgi:hypothetical protein